MHLLPGEIRAKGEERERERERERVEREERERKVISFFQSFISNWPLIGAQLA